MSKTQLVKRGFYLECPNCEAPDWYPLDRIREFLDCSAGPRVVVEIRIEPAGRIERGAVHDGEVGVVERMTRGFDLFLVAGTGRNGD